MYIHLDPQSIISDSICRCYIHLSVLSYNHGWTMTHAQDTCSAIPRYPASIYTSRCKSIHLRLLQLSAPTSFPSNGWLSSCGKWKSRYWRKLPEFEPGSRWQPKMTASRESGDEHGWTIDFCGILFLVDKTNFIYYQEIQREMEMSFLCLRMVPKPCWPDHFMKNASWVPAKSSEIRTASNFKTAKLSPKLSIRAFGARQVQQLEEVSCGKTDQLM